MAKGSSQNNDTLVSRTLLEPFQSRRLLNAVRYSEDTLTLLQEEEARIHPDTLQEFRGRLTR
jgi:hypothetical protein